MTNSPSKASFRKAFQEASKTTDDSVKACDKLLERRPKTSQCLC